MLSAKKTRFTPKDFKRVKHFHKLKRLSKPIPWEVAGKFAKKVLAKYDDDTLERLFRLHDFK